LLHRNEEKEAGEEEKEQGHDNKKEGRRRKKVLVGTKRR
jgi:hypothetical protein